MGYASLRDAVDDLDRAGHLRRIEIPVDARLEVSEIHRRVFALGGPALYFSNVKGCSFPVVCNLFGTMDRARYMFRDALPGIRALVRAKTSPAHFLKSPLDSISLARSALALLPRPSFRAPVLERECKISALPQIVSWPDDGGAFITLPQVYSEDPEKPGLRFSNLGMYRVQLGGNEYVQNAEVGLHYQLHRGIGVHHSHAIARSEPLP
jgi:4-hydroxy-3-polyprenylbenzoate decarboxylase